MHLSKCTLKCDKSDCGYKLSQGSEMNFKYFCVDGDKYFKDYEGSWRDTPKAEESGAGIECEGEKDIKEEVIETNNSN